MRLYSQIMLAIVALLLVTSLSEATFRWRFQDATGQVCYNINASLAPTGFLSNTWYSVAPLNFSLNQTFWNGTLRSYHPDSGSNLSQFVYAFNATHAFVFVPVAKSLSSGQLDAYCTYAGSSNMSDIINVSPFGLAFDGNLSHLMIDNTSACTTSMNPDGTMNISGSNICAWKDLSAPGTQQITLELWTKVKRITSNTTSGSNSIIGIFSGNNTVNSSGVGIGTFEDNMSHGWYSVDSPIGGAVDTQWHIFQVAGATNSVSSVDRGTVYNESVVVQGTSLANYPSTFNILNRIYPVYLRNASAIYDWSIAFRGDTGTTKLSASNVTYDFINPNITILSPVWESTIGAQDAVTMQVKYLTAFDNCTISIQGTNVLFYSGITAGQTSSDTINNSQISTGENQLIVSCRDSSNVETHRYWYFTKSGSGVSALFSQAFNININNEGCPAATLDELNTKCFEAYNLTQVYPFGAVVCMNLNASKDYACINEFDNRTKNNFTLFWGPTSWDYDSSEDIPHIGATFFISGTKMNGRIELYNPTKFMYIPAQSKPRDCEIFYSSSSTGCSYWEGFVVNNASIIVSDENNNWFQSGGTGIENFNINFSQSVINVNVLPIINQTPSFFPNGIFTRQSCRLVNGSWMIDVVNTQAQTYTVTIIGNTSQPSFSVMASSLSVVINTSGVSLINLATQNSTLCTFGQRTSIFLPFNIPGIGIDGYTIILWAGLLFGTVLSAITPFALFIPFILNDVYQLLDVYKMALIGIFAIVAGFANNAFSYERGIKHFILVLVITLGFIVTLGDYQSALGGGIDLIGYRSMMDSLTHLMTINSLADFAFNLAGFLISLFLFIIFIPASFILLLMQLLAIVSPVLHSQVGVFAPYIAIGMMAYFYLKAFEVLSNRFRTV